MHLTRRAFGRLAGGSGLVHICGRGFAQVPSNLNRSYINGVQFGLQPFCYHDLAMTPENRNVLLRRLVQNGMGMVELHATWVEPRFDAAGVSAAEAREKLRRWRAGTPPEYYRNIRKEFEEAGVTIFTYYVTFNERDSDADIDANFAAAQLLGAMGVVGSYGLAMARRLTPFPEKHGLFTGLHNHDNLSDPDAFSTETTLEKGLSFSPLFKATLDVRHFTAGNGDCLGFLERHHDRVSSVHLGDRRKNNGRSTPFGEGDAPIIQILRVIKDNGWPIVALLEFEHGTLRPAVEEVAIQFDYCKRAIG